MTFGTNKLVSLTKIFFNIHIAALNMLNKGTSGNVKRFTVRTTITNRNICRTTLWTINNFIVKSSFKNPRLVKPIKKSLSFGSISHNGFNHRITITQLTIVNGFKLAYLTTDKLI